MPQKIQVRRDTAANWVSANPILASGEPGYETDTNLFKFGDGSTAWNSLPYAPSGLGQRTVTSGPTSLTAKDRIVLANATSGAFELDLVAATGWIGILIISATTTGLNKVTLDPNGTDTIDGQATLELGTEASGAPYKSVTLIPNGTDWVII